MMVYIAAPFFNEVQVERVEQVEALFDALGVDYFSPRLEAPTLKDLSPKERQLKSVEVFQSNLQGMHDASVIFAGIDDKDTGTTWEMGFAYGLNRKPIVTWSLEPKPVNVMLAQCTAANLVGAEEIGQFWALAHKSPSDLWRAIFRHQGELEVNE